MVDTAQPSAVPTGLLPTFTRWAPKPARMYVRFLGTERPLNRAPNHCFGSITP